MEPLYSHQINALKKMHNGCILCGGVGTGKSRTALAYYHMSCGGTLKIDGKGEFTLPTEPRPLYIITTAKKRDSGEWEDECLLFHVDNYTIDSWNNIKKYQKVYGAFFIFDEQRVVGSGAWAKTFVKISRRNKWVLLSASPGDNWSDYIPVFVANGFYRNKTEFLAMHAVWNRFSKYPKIDHFVDINILEEHRDAILVTMPYERHTVAHHMYIECQYDKKKYRTVWRDRWNPYEDEPIAEPSALFYCMRKVVNTDLSRGDAILDILKEHPHVIIFYNFDYELAAIKAVLDFERHDITYSEWNGHRHQSVPDCDGPWVYLVQYTAGSEGWNCITTDTVIFYSMNYSYKVMVQAAGRIDRLNTPFEHLYYYHLRSFAPIDIAIAKALKEKKKFNENAYLRRRVKKPTT